MKLSRRTFIASAALAPVACGVPLGYERGTPVVQPKPTPNVRPPQVGQEWTYVKRAIFDGKILGTVTEKVTSLGSAIVIERIDESGGRLANEIQGSWGMVQTTTAWPRVISFNPPIPLWPQELGSNWSKQLNTKYSLAGYSGNSYAPKPQNPSSKKLFIFINLNNCIELSLITLMVVQQVYHVYELLDNESSFYHDRL